MQGEFTQLLIEEEESATWQSIVRGLPRNIMSFCVKLASNALPSADNLRRWGKRVMATCPLCSCPNGTLAHIINFCLGHTADIKCMSSHGLCYPMALS